MGNMMLLVYDGEKKYIVASELALIFRIIIN